MRAAFSPGGCGMGGSGVWFVGGGLPAEPCGASPPTLTHVVSRATPPYSWAINLPNPSLPLCAITEHGAVQSSGVKVKRSALFPHHLIRAPVNSRPSASNACTLT
jgi:hypothetical protein